MESTHRDLQRVAELRAHRVQAVEHSSQAQLRTVFESDNHDNFCAVYVVKLLDVHPRLGKVAGRRLMEVLHLDSFARVGDVSVEIRNVILEACGESHV